jgi:hypothetical protein|tara:strand:- start:1634 stop:2578 length:945 start_codon:yes stop_codon:yes gene_type:complete
MKYTPTLSLVLSFSSLSAIISILALGCTVRTADASKILFIGNSFTYGAGSAVQFYRTDSVTDLNDDGRGGVPALFKAFTQQAGLEFEVFHDLIPGSGLDKHLAEKKEILSQHWDIVNMHGYSTLDKSSPGDPSTLIWSAKDMAQLLFDQNPDVSIYLEATWSRADQTYPEDGHWHGNPIHVMAKDIRAGYNKAAASNPAILGVIPVGEAWNRAFVMGVADSNPYDGISYGQVDLWTNDHYHGGTYGYYLAALMIFGEVTGYDPRSLGEEERAAFELGVSKEQAQALQEVAYQELQHETPHRNLKTFEPSPLPKQ